MPDRYVAKRWLSAHVAAAVSVIRSWIITDTGVYVTTGVAS
jgi:hypothetical protein